MINSLGTKLLGIVVLGLLFPCIAFAKIINIENKVELKVPDNFDYIKVDEYSEYFGDFFSALGDDANFYYLGTNDSIEFANLLITDQEKLLNPLMSKMETKNFKTEKSMINFMSKEFKKLIKKYNYDGVIWVYISSENLEDSDAELFETVNSIKNMSNNDLKRETLKYKEILKDELDISNVDGLNMKISKFIIEKNPNDDPAFDLKIAANMFNIKWDLEVYGYINNNKPILVGSECLGSCKNIKGVKNKINFSNLLTTKSSTTSSSIVDDLNKLNELYKSGVLTKEEFDKAKKKILN